MIITLLIGQSAGQTITTGNGNVDLLVEKTGFRLGTSSQNTFLGDI